MIPAARGICVALAVVLLSFNIPGAFAKCPVTDGATVVVRAPLGDLQVDTTSRESFIDVLVDSNLIQLQETCLKDHAEYTSNTPDPAQIRGSIVWKIVTPKTVDLDLVTLSGGITTGDVNGTVVARTAGGSITTGQIKGDASISTQGGVIKAGNIGGNAELRSQGGTLEVGDVGGKAEFHTTAGQIRAGIVGGSVIAVGGRTITITRAGEVQATTNAGDISIGDAARINAKTSGGNITSRRVRGPFQGHTESGDILLDSAAAWVEASTGNGKIVVHLVPENIDGDLHMDLQAGIGDITVYVPQRMKATIDASIQRPALQQQIVSDFPMNGLAAVARPPQGLIPNRFYAPTHSQSLLNGGGNSITLHTSLGKIVIRRQ